MQTLLSQMENYKDKNIMDPLAWSLNKIPLTSRRTKKRMRHSATAFRLLCSLFVLSSNTPAHTLTSLNLKNFNPNPSEDSRWVEFLRQSSSTLFAFQEIKNAKALKRIMQKAYPEMNGVVGNCGGSGGQKLAFYYSERFELKRFEERLELSKGAPDSSAGCNKGLRPLLIAALKDRKTGKSFTWMNLHLKARGDARSFRKRQYQLSVLAKFIRRERKEFSQTKIVVSGDWNTTGYQQRQGQRYAFYQNWSKKNQGAFLTDQLGCSNYWEGKNRRDSLQEASLLDHIWATSNFAEEGSFQSIIYGAYRRFRCKKIPNAQAPMTTLALTDHCPVSITPSVPSALADLTKN